jgi:hypothetical protein
MCNGRDEGTFLISSVKDETCTFGRRNSLRRRSQWPRRLRHRSAAKRLLGSWVPIPPGHGCLCLVQCLCCQVDVSATGRSLVQGSPTDCGVCLTMIK